MPADDAVLRIRPPCVIVMTLERMRRDRLNRNHRPRSQRRSPRCRLAFGPCGARGIVIDDTFSTVAT